MRLLYKSLVFTAVFATAYSIFYNQLHNHYTPDGDMIQHYDFCYIFAANFDSCTLHELQEYKFVGPHFGLVVTVFTLSCCTGWSVKASFIMTLSLFCTLYALLVFTAVKRLTGAVCVDGHLLFLTIVLLVAGPVIAPTFNNIFLGQFTPNIWHNATFLMARPFALLITLCFPWLLNKVLSSTLPRVALLSLALQVALVTSAVLKPNYAISFVPAALMFIVLCEKFCWKVYLFYAASILPLLATLVWQANVIQNAISIDWLAVWRNFSPNPFISLGLSLCFPATLIIVHPRALVSNKYLIFSWLLAVTAVLQFALFIETNHRAMHGNFSWAAHLIMAPLFVCSAAALLSWLQSISAGWFTAVRQGIACVALALHAMSGIIYTFHIMSGKSFVGRL